jgi:hypothetical protein
MTTLEEVRRSLFENPEIDSQLAQQAWNVFLSALRYEELLLNNPSR